MRYYLSLFSILLSTSELCYGQPSFLGEYKYCWMEGCIILKIKPNNKIEHINKNWRGENKCNGYWEQKNDSTLSVYLYGAKIDTQQFNIVSEWGIRYIDNLTPKFNDDYQRTKSFDNKENVSMIYEYESGKKYQTHKKIFPSGQVKEIIRYKRFRLHGAWQVFDKNGGLISEKVYRKGCLVK